MLEAMGAYLTGRTAGVSTDALFTDDRGSRMTQAGVIKRVRTLLDRAGLEGKEFSGISLRRGGSQTLMRLGASDKVIMAMGRWQTDCFRRYLKIEDRRAMASQHGQLQLDVKKQQKK